MGYCYFCDEWIGYYSDYFCEDCKKLKNLSNAVGVKKITENIKIRFDKQDDSSYDKPSDNTRSKSTQTSN